MNGSEALVAVWIIIAVAAVSILRGPLGKAIARRLEGKPRPEETAELLDEVRHRAEVQDVLEARVAELEERVDFAERMLAREREVHRLSQGPS